VRITHLYPFILYLTTYPLFRKDNTNLKGPDEIKYLDDEALETAETLRLMPLELRDPMLMDDYLKLPRLNLK
jgi:hypothetical protein